jgi:hypothetical protein
MSEEIKPNTSHIDAVNQSDSERESIKAHDELYALRAASSPSFIVPPKQTVSAPDVKPIVVVPANVTTQPELKEDK